MSTDDTETIDVDPEEYDRHPLVSVQDIELVELPYADDVMQDNDEPIEDTA